MKKRNAYRNIIKLTVSVIYLFNATVLLAQPMEKQGAHPSPTVNTKAVAKDMEPAFTLALIPTDDNNKVIVDIANPGKKKLRISIMSENSWNLFNQTIEAEEYKKRFDFSQAEDGIYTIVVAEGKKRIEKVINLNSYREVLTRKMEISEVQ